jgi:hypothetical protein
MPKRSQILTVLIITSVLFISNPTHGEITSNVINVGGTWITVRPLDEFINIPSDSRLFEITSRLIGTEYQLCKVYVPASDYSALDVDDGSLPNNFLFLSYHIQLAELEPSYIDFDIFSKIDEYYQEMEKHYYKFRFIDQYQWKARHQLTNAGRNPLYLYFGGANILNLGVNKFSKSGYSISSLQILENMIGDQSELIKAYRFDYRIYASNKILTVSAISVNNDHEWIKSVGEYWAKYLIATNKSKTGIKTRSNQSKGKRLPSELEEILGSTWIPLLASFSLIVGAIIIKKKKKDKYFSLFGSKDPEVF